MPYKKQIAKKNKSVISENLRTYLLTGDREKADVEVFRLSGSPHRLQLVWDAVKKEILNNWIKQHPCTRPFIFWILAPEKRKKVSGSGGWRPGMAIDSDGLPQYWQLWWSKKHPPNFESQATFLDRNGFLTPAEKKYLEKNPKLLKPERIEYEYED